MVTVDGIQNTLSNAEDWGTWDLVGGGLLAGIAKHDQLDNAQAQLTQLQAALRRLRSELLDVDVSADFQIRIDGFLRFADFFFDGLFADWAVLDRIHDAQPQVDQVGWQIREILDNLRLMRSVHGPQVAHTPQQLADLELPSIALM